jgi:hypothetical protein
VLTTLLLVPLLSLIGCSSKPTSPVVNIDPERILFIPVVGVQLSIRCNDQEIASVPAQRDDLTPIDREQMDFGSKVRRAFRDEGTKPDELPEIAIWALLPDGWSRLATDEVTFDLVPRGLVQPRREGEPLIVLRHAVIVELSIMDRFFGDLYVDNRGGEATKISIGRWENTIPKDYIGEWWVARPSTKESAVVRLNGLQIGSLWRLANGPEWESVFIDTSGRRLYELREYYYGSPVLGENRKQLHRFGPGFWHPLSHRIDLLMKPAPATILAHPAGSFRTTLRVVNEVK